MSKFNKPKFVEGNDEIGYTIKSYDLSMNKSKAESEVRYDISGSGEILTLSDKEFFHSDDLISIDTLEAQASVTRPSLPNHFKCNFSFDLNLGIKFKLPDLNAPAPNFDLLYSISDFAEEVSKINDDIIVSMQQFNCCDCNISNSYNFTIVPFFRFLADDENIKYCSYDANPKQDCGSIFGFSLSEKILSIAKTLVQMYVVVRPLVCLIRPLPGNPNWLADFDHLYWVRYIISIFDVYYDIIVSGKLFNKIFLNPTKKIRQTIEVCLFGAGDADYAAKLNLTVLKYRQIKNQISTLNKKKVKIQKKYNDLNELLSRLKNSKVEITIEEITSLKKFGNESVLISVIPETSSDKITKITSTVNKLLCSNYRNEIIRPTDKCILSNRKLIPDSLYNKKTYKFSYVIKNSKHKAKEYTIYYSTKEIDNFSEFDAGIEYLLNDVYNFYTTKIQDKETDLKNSNLELKFLNRQLKIIRKQFTIFKTANNINREESVENSIMSGTYLKKASIVKMANNNSMCDCLITSLENLVGKSFKIPLPEKIYDITEEGLKNIVGKESFRLVYGDFIDPSKIYNETRSISEKMKNKFSEEKMKNTDFLYSKNFVKSLIDSYKSLDSYIKIEKHINKDKHNYYMEIYNEIIPLDDEEKIKNFMKLKTNESNHSDLTNYLRALEHRFSTEYKILYTIKNSKIEIENSKGYIKSFQVYNFDENILPSEVELGAFTLFRKGTRKLIEREYNLQQKRKKIIIEVKEQDYHKWKVFNTKLNKALNKFKEKKISNEDNLSFSNISKSMEYDRGIQILQETQKNIGFYYPSFELNDSNEDYFYLKSIKKDVDQLNKSIKEISKIKDNIILSDLEEVKKALLDFEIFREYFVFKYDETLQEYPVIQYYYSEKLIIDAVKWIDSNYIITDWVWKRPNIPCDCDGVICKLIQIIINIFLSMITEFIQRIFGYLMDLFWKSPIGKMIKFIIAKIKCVMELINVKSDLKDLKDLTKSIKESLANNIKLYSDPSSCFRSEFLDEPFPIQYDPQTHSVSIPDSITPDNLDNDVQDQKGINGNDIDDPNYNPNYDIQTKEGKNGETIININGGDIPKKLVPVYNKQEKVNNNLPVTLVLTPRIKVGYPIKYHNHKFNLLDFDCPCAKEQCEACNEETKEETNKILNLN